MSEQQDRQLAVLKAVLIGIEDMDIDIEDAALVDWIAQSLGVKIEIKEPHYYDTDPQPQELLVNPSTTSPQPQIKIDKNVLETIDRYLPKEPEPGRTVQEITKPRKLRDLTTSQAFKVRSIKSAIGEYKVALTVDTIESAIKKAHNKETVEIRYLEGPSAGRVVDVRADRLIAVIKEGVATLS